MSYTQLTREQRYQIYALMKAGQNQTQIASIIGCHKTTISREVRRNRGQRGYRPKQAQEKAAARHLAAYCPRITQQTWTHVELLVRREWSPEQIAGRLRLEKHATVSHERIYQHIYADKRAGGDLYRHLRCQKQRRKRYGAYDRRGQLPDRVSISQRPQIVDSKRRLGDWEADTIIGQRHQQALVSLTERKSKLTRLKKVERNTAEAVAQASLALLGTGTGKVHTITSDNGREFAAHKQIAARLSAKFYFAHPYASWERGLNENTNGLVRQYFPKKSDFSKTTDEEIAGVMERLNNRPRKTLGFRTPNEVFFKRRSVALQS
ncbi:MAG: IS30 family transposase [Acidobacteria bacterium]|nr:IS30 family transposase [Acidobacteriota bacterium]